MRLKRLLMALFVVVAVAVPAVFGCPPGDACVDLIYHYYSDGTFTTVVAFYEHDCDFNTTQWGTTSDWRRMDSYGCETGIHTVRCSHWNGSSWVQVTCP